MKLFPLSARVLFAPRQTFAEVERRGKGYGLMLLFLAAELAMVAPTDVAAHLAVGSYTAWGGFAGLYATFINYALAPLIGVFAAGVVLYFLRRRTPARLELWPAASVIAYAWVPHTLLVAAGALLATIGLDHPVLPHHRFSSVSGSWTLLKLFVELTPTMIYAALAVRPGAQGAQVKAAAKVEPEAEGSGGKSVPTPGDLPAVGPRGWAVITAATLLVLGGLGASALYAADNWERARPALPGDATPAFSVASLDGQHRFTNTDLHGKVTLIDFWATWCGPCVSAMPGVAELHRDLAPRGLSTLSINIEPDALAAVRRFAADRELPFTVYVDNGNAQRSFRIRTYPTYLLVDRNGRIREIFIGSTSMSTLRENVETLLAEETRPVL